MNLCIELYKITGGFVLNNILLKGVEFIFNLCVLKNITLQKNNSINITNTHSLINACMLSCYSINYLLTYDNSYFNIIKYIHIGYLLRDNYNILIKYPISIYNDKNVYIIHHILFIMGWYNAPLNFLIYNKLILAELSVVTLNIRFLMKNNGFKYYDVFSFITYIFFLIFRVINYTYLYYTEYDILGKKLKYLIVPLLLLQYYWFILLTQKLILFFKK
tara:strand:+ start:20 stop:673 length:654 start_codon:yes stop_codon:yes gene_type:complete